MVRRQQKEMSYDKDRPYIKRTVYRRSIFGDREETMERNKPKRKEFEFKELKGSKMKYGKGPKVSGRSVQNINRGLWGL